MEESAWGRTSAQPHSRGERRHPDRRGDRLRSHSIPASRLHRCTVPEGAAPKRRERTPDSAGRDRRWAGKPDAKIRRARRVHHLCRTAQNVPSAGSAFIPAVECCTASRRSADALSEGVAAFAHVDATTSATQHAPSMSHSSLDALRCRHREGRRGDAEKMSRPREGFRKPPESTSATRLCSFKLRTRRPGTPVAQRAA